MLDWSSRAQLAQLEEPSQTRKPSQLGARSLELNTRLFPLRTTFARTSSCRAWNFRRLATTSGAPLPAATSDRLELVIQSVMGKCGSGLDLGSVCEIPAVSDAGCRSGAPHGGFREQNYWYRRAQSSCRYSTSFRSVLGKIKTIDILHHQK